jgi:AGZA family xanthine/uracil permease-like MFS transporter
LFFGFSALFAPFFQEIPEPATTPLVIFVGFMLFDNVKRMNWTTIRDAFPAFIVLFLIPFSYNVLGGVIFGFGCWVVLSFTTTGEAAVGTRNIFSMYAPQMVRQCGMAA